MTSTQVNLHKPQTLKRQIYALIKKHGLHEILDRLADLVDDEAEVSDSHDLAQLAVSLEVATENALVASHHVWE